MKKLIALTLASSMALGVGCTSKEFGDLVRTGTEVATGDKDKADQYGSLADSLTGAVTPVGIETELNLGEGLALMAYDQLGPRYENEAAQRYVNLVGRTVARQSTRPDLPYSFAIIVNDDPLAVAGPGGYILVSTGALKLMKTEAELAGVLAHEVAHVTERHMLQTYRRQNLFQAAFKAAEMLDEEKAEEYGEAVNQASETLFDKGLDKDFEYEADLVGTEIAALTGYDPRGLRDFLTTLSQQPGAQSGGWFSTHPDLGSRVSRLNSFVSDDLGGATGVVNADRFKKSVLDAMAATPPQQSVRAESADLKSDDRLQSSGARDAIENARESRVGGRKSQTTKSKTK